MGSMSTTTIGLLLQSIPYLGRKKILKIFTPEQGLVSLFAHTAFLTPFCLAEWVYHKSSKEMQVLQDAKLIDPLLHLRENYKTLSCAGAMAHDLLRTQLPGKAAPDLFELALYYLRNLPKAPDLLADSFRLKLLLHEGVLSSTPEPAFTPTEWGEVCMLAFSRSLAEIQGAKASPHAKIQALLDERL